MGSEVGKSVKPQMVQGFKKLTGDKRSETPQWQGKSVKPLSDLGLQGGARESQGGKRREGRQVSETSQWLQGGARVSQGG